MARVPPGLLVLLPLQIGAEALVLGLDWAIDGGVGLLLPGVAAAVVAGGVGFWLRSRGPGSRAMVRRLGLASGLLHVPVGALAYATAWWVAPAMHGFDAAMLPFAAGCVGLLVGGLALLGTTCALDLGMHAGGGVEAPAAPRRSFREPPG